MEPILVKYISDTSGLKEAQSEMLSQLDALQAKEEELKKKIADSSKEYAKQKLDIQAAGKSAEELDKAMAVAHQKHAKEQQNLRKELNATRGSIEELSDALNEVDAAITSGALNTTFSKRLKEIKEELRGMEAAGDNTSQRFIQLSVEAAKLENQIGDTNAQIRALSSDTKGLDATMGVGQGLTGTFAALQSGMALVGGESEVLQQTFFKVQAAMQLLNGVNMVANAVNKDSNANVIIRNWLSSVTAKNKAKEAAATVVSAAATTAESAVVKKATVTPLGFPFRSAPSPLQCLFFRPQAAFLQMLHVPPQYPCLPEG